MSHSIIPFLSLSFSFSGSFFFIFLLSITPQKLHQHPDPVGWSDNEAIRARFGDSKSKTGDRDGRMKESRSIQVL